YHRPIARNDCARQDRGWFQRGAHASGCRARPTWAAATPTILVTGTYFTGGDPGRSYDISADGKRLLMIKQGAASEETAAPASLIVVLNSVEGLKRLVPTK